MVSFFKIGLFLRANTEKKDLKVHSLVKIGLFLSGIQGDPRISGRSAGESL
jgi:hypothetical protein